MAKDKGYRKRKGQKSQVNLKNQKANPSKDPRRKPKYGMFSCVGYIYRLLWQTNKSLVFTGIFTVPITLILSALALYTPSAILSVLEGAERFSSIALVILGLLLTKLVFDLANNLIEHNNDNSEHHVLMRMIYMLNTKHRTRDMHHDYDVEVKKMDERANKAIQNNHTSGVHFPMDFAGMVATVLNFVIFGSVISTLNPLIILLLAVGCIADFLLGKWRRNQNYREQDDLNAIDKKVWYSTGRISQDFKFAKDIRLYTMGDYMHDRLQGLFDVAAVFQKKREMRGQFTSLISFLIIMLRDGFAYGFLIYKVVSGDVDAAGFVLYFNAMTSMAGFMTKILDTWGKIAEGAMQISDFREAMELEDKLNRGEGIPVPKGPFSIEFKNVSYQYPKGEKKVLDNVSFKIEAGEKIALVGLNGAGKTTLTMLMCGMLLPDEGEVLLDGHTLYEYNRDEMYGLFGIVPQRYNLLPVSIAKNIASAMTEEEIDWEKLDRCIELAGFSEKIASLPKGAETPLNREINRDGVELSGGEAQKLLLARLIYKNPPCMILDEPTAALDPIAEDKMYRKYNEFAAHATSIFISHRLASTRFCNRIFLLDGAKIAEMGSHEELMARGGKYKELFDVQSKYYREGGEENDAEECGTKE